MPVGVYVVAGIVVLLVVVGVWATRGIRKEREAVGDGLQALGLTYHPRENVNPRNVHRILMAEGTYRGLAVTVEDDFPRRPGGDGTVISPESRIQADGLDEVPEGRVASRRYSREAVTGMRSERTGDAELDDVVELWVERAEDADPWRRLLALPAVRALVLRRSGTHRFVHLEVAAGQATVQLNGVTAPADVVAQALDALVELQTATR